MPQRRRLMAGNWKMNGLLADGVNRARDLAARARAATAGGELPEVVLCPPATILGEVGRAIAGSPVLLGAQDCHGQDKGAHTGDIAAPMLAELGCRYVIVGHSERRSLYGERNDAVAAKFVAAVQGGLTPILCLGETLEQREGNVTEQVIAAQLDAVTQAAGMKGFANAVIAYEPVWAIGTGRTATPQQAQDVHAFIRGRLAKSDAALAQRIQILYGGSVKPQNAAELFVMADIDGGLIGGASLVAQDFLAICQATG